MAETVSEEIEGNDTVHEHRQDADLAVCGLVVAEERANPLPGLTIRTSRFRCAKLLRPASRRCPSVPVGDRWTMRFEDGSELESPAERVRPERT
jgi:hypothetical protein